MSRQISNLLVVGRTDTGKVGELNEDSICIDRDLNLYAVADGMGGHDAGEVASKNTLFLLRQFFWKNMLSYSDEDLSIGDDAFTDKYLLTHFPQSNPAAQQKAYETVSSAISYANQGIHKLNVRLKKMQNKTMGTTLSGILIYKKNEAVVIFHVGDSRIYRLRQNRMMLLTMDHNLFERWKREGMQGPPPKGKNNIITRAIGPTPEVVPDISVQSMIPNDIFLICSDGLTGMISDTDIQNTLSQANKDNLREKCQDLVDMANANGGVDNITAILLGFFC